MDKTGKIKTFSFVSLDGYAAKMGGSIDWLTGYPRPSSDRDYGFGGFAETVGCAVLNGIYYAMLQTGHRYLASTRNTDESAVTGPLRIDTGAKARFCAFEAGERFRICGGCRGDPAWDLRGYMAGRWPGTVIPVYGTRADRRDNGKRSARYTRKRIYAFQP